MEGQKITQSITTLFKGADERDWQKVRGVMAKNVLLDYSAMSGAEPSMQSPEQITDMWACFLPGFDKTHHHVSGFHVKLHGNKANVHYIGKTEHFIGDEVWTVDGAYDTELEKEGDKWLITAHKFNFEKQSGNTGLVKLAKQKLGILG